MKQTNKTAAPASVKEHGDAQDGLKQAVKDADVRKAASRRGDALPDLPRRAMFRERHPDEPA